MAVTDDLNAAITALTFNDYNNAPISQLLINQLQACAAQLSPGAPLSELNDAISQLQWAAPNNAPVGIAVINELSDVLSQLLNGTLTTNPPDVNAISQLTSAILAQEPDWANRLWINWDSPSTTLTVQVRDLYTIALILTEVPWSTHWDNYTDAATDVVLQVWGQYTLPQMAAGASLSDLVNLDGPCIPSG